VVIRYRYQDAVDPPAPFVQVTLIHPATGAALTGVPAQVDSGADRTVLPPRLVEALELPHLTDKPVAGLGGEVSRLPVYGVLLGVHDLPARFQAVYACDGEPWVLLGRDVLNRFRVVLDGPASAVQIERPA
jgi:predicted aspartyl protease